MANITRKLTTILAAGIAGYARLAEIDEQGTVERLRALRAELINGVIAANSGRIVKTTGDDMLIEFASVADAVRCAVGVQRGVAARNVSVAPDIRIEFCVGIHLGDVILERDGEMRGEAVDIAARLEGVCEPGGVCLSRAAFDQVAGKIDEHFTDRGDVELKNIARPVRVYAIAMTGRHP